MATHHFIESEAEKLITAAEKGHISDATKALVAGADPNCRYRGRNRHHLVNNDTPLHISARRGDVVLVKLLIVFDADLNLKNRNRETPVEVARPACREIIEKILKLRKDLETRDHKTAKPPPKPDDDDVFILCLDGGGIRGLVFIQALIEMEKRYEQLYGQDHAENDSKPLRFLHHFNWIAGTSTGGIAALAIATGRSLTDCRGVYFNVLRNKVLTKYPPFSDDIVERSLQDVFGNEEHMSSIKEYNVAVITTLADCAPPKLHIMSNYGDERDEQLEPDKRLIWEAARATSAAVPFFHPFDGKFVDGGFVAAVNPTVDAIVDIDRYFTKQQRRQKLKIKAVVSLGCGDMERGPFQFDKQSEFHELLQKKFDKVLSARSHKRIEDGIFALFNGATFMKCLELCASQVGQATGEAETKGEVLAEAFGAKYHRINPRLNANINFVESDDEKLIDMVYTTLFFMLENYTEKMDRVLEAIVEN